jgi:hypothetical protein
MLFLHDVGFPSTDGGSMTPDRVTGKRGASIAADHVKGFHIIARHSLELGAANALTLPTLRVGPLPLP